MRHLVAKVSYLSVTCLLMLSTGCGGDNDNRDKVVVKGTVSVDGAPMGGVLLGFFSPGEKVAVGAVRTQDDGTYEVMFKAHAGEGNYKVTATKLIPKPGAKVSTPGEGIDDFQLGLAQGSSAPVNLLPEKYSTVDKSDLSTVIQKGTNEGKNFAIKTK